MADMRNNNRNHNVDMQELLRMLDEMQKNTRTNDVEEELVGGDPSDLIQVDAYIPPVVGTTYDPTATPDFLNDILITPEYIEEIEEQREMERQARLLLEAEEEEAEEENLPPPPTNRRNPFKVMVELVAPVFPRRGDRWYTVLGKSGILTGAVALLAVLGILMMQMVVLPIHNRQYNDKMAKWYNAENTAVVTDTDRYPEGMLATFKRFYQVNPDVKGFVSYHAEGENDFLDIDYPVVQTDDNTTYLDTDFHGRFNRNGTLFFDEKCHIGNGDTNRSLIIHGNNLGNGQMLSGFNHLIGNEAYARKAYKITLSTLYDTSDYYVFAVLLLDKDETLPIRTLPLQNRFITTDAFFEYVQKLRDRSMFDYPTDMVDTDSLLLMVTDLGKMNGTLDNGQVVVAARRVRPGEQPYNPEKIAPNEDVLMPYRWYQNRGITPPDIYRGKEDTQSTTTTTLTPTGDDTTTDTTDSTTDTSATETESTTEDTTTTEEETTTTEEPTSTLVINATVIGGVIEPPTTTTAPIEETDPTGEETDPTGEETDPTGEETDPTGEETDPTEIQE